MNPHGWTAQQVADIERKLKILADIRNKELTDEILDLYIGVLIHLPYACADDACQKSVITHKFFPSPAELVEPYKEVLNLHTAKIEQAVNQAFIEAHQAAICLGPNVTVQFEDPRISEVVSNFGGWPEFCSLNKIDAELPIVKAQFSAMYKAIKTTPTPRPSIGFLEGQKPVKIERGFNIASYIDKQATRPKIEQQAPKTTLPEIQHQIAHLAQKMDARRPTGETKNGGDRHRPRG